METCYYHYTDQPDIGGCIRNGIYSCSAFTLDEYYDASLAGQRLGIPPPVWMSKFKNDIGLRELTGGIVDQSKRYAGGGTQFVYTNRIKPIAKRRIYERNWTPV